MNDTDEAIGALSQHDWQMFKEHGFLIADRILPLQTISELARDIELEIDRRAEALIKARKLSHTRQELPFTERYAALYRECPEIGELTATNLPGNGLGRLVRHPALIDRVTSLIPDAIALNPTVHLRAKMPDGLRAENGLVDADIVPWHQDAWEDDIHPETCDMITVWIPLVDAGPHNGCLEFLPGGFQLGKLLHESSGGGRISPDVFPAIPALAAPCRQEGALFFHKHSPHRSTRNLSDGIRWSLDVRYQSMSANNGRGNLPSLPLTVETTDEEFRDWCSRLRLQDASR